MAKKPKTILFPNPKNPNNRLSNKHCFYVASSGGGKTSAVKNMPKEKRMLASHAYVFFDPFGDYEGMFKGRPVHHYDKRGDFYRALLKARTLKTPFRIAYQPNMVSKAEMDFFCGAVWSVGDGKKPLHVVLEEVAQFVDTSGNATGYLNNLISVGRKFGLMLTLLFQRGQAVPKTLIGNCEYRWVGYQARPNDAVYLAGETGMPVEAIAKLNKLQYLYGNDDHYEPGQLRFKTA